MTDLKSRLMGASRNIDMTQGDIFSHLLKFALPLLVGNIFQQLYNTVDTWIVGNYVGDVAFSAVGSLTPVINTLIGLFTGLATGAGVIIAQYYGAKEYEKVRKTVHTAIAITAILSIVFAVIGILITPAMLALMKVPAHVAPYSQKYLTIYFAGIAGLLFYNMIAGILRAVGNSTYPFYYLVVCVVMNIGLDLLFVIGLGLGVEGVAYATIIAQGCSALLSIITLLKIDACVRLSFRQIRIHRAYFLKIIVIGFPTALQMAITSFSNVFIQSYINHFGSDCMGGWTAFTKVDQLLLLPMQSISLAITTFVGQNLGISQVKRAKRGVHTALTLSLAVTISLSVIVVLAAPFIVEAFNKKPEVVSYGVQFLRFLTPCLALECITQIYAGALRGAGNSRRPMAIILFSFVLFRQVYFYIAANYISSEILPIAFGYPASWMVSDLLILICYYRTDLSAYRLTRESNTGKS